MMKGAKTMPKFTENLNEMRADQCRCCNNVRGNKETKTFGVYECAKCGALFGQCYLGDSYGFVLPYMTSKQVEPDQQRYFDFTTLGSAGVGRRHGWFDPSTRLITQVG